MTATKRCAPTWNRRQADFSGITGLPTSQYPLAVGEILHRAVIDVTEEGTQARGDVGGVFGNGRVQCEFSQRKAKPPRDGRLFERPTSGPLKPLSVQSAGVQEVAEHQPWQRNFACVRKATFGDIGLRYKLRQG